MVICAEYAAAAALALAAEEKVYDSETATHDVLSLCIDDNDVILRVVWLWLSVPVKHMYMHSAVSQRQHCGQRPAPRGRGRGAPQPQRRVSDCNFLALTRRK